jgi:hypothetical protein
MNDLNPTLRLTRPRFLMHVYEIRPRKDKRGFDLISDALPFGRARVHRSRHNRF